MSMGIALRVTWSIDRLRDKMSQISSDLIRARGNIWISALMQNPLLSDEERLCRLEAKIEEVTRFNEGKQIATMVQATRPSVTAPPEFIMTEETILDLNNQAYFEVRFNEVRQRISDVSDIETAHRYTAEIYQIKSDPTSNIAYRIDCLASLSRQLEAYLSKQKKYREAVKILEHPPSVTTQAANTSATTPPAYILTDKYPNRIDDSWPPKSDTSRARLPSLEIMADIVLKVSHLGTDDDIKAGLSGSLDPEFGAYPLHLACEIIKAYRRRGRTGLEETTKEVARAIMGGQS